MKSSTLKIISGIFVIICVLLPAFTLPAFTAYADAGPVFAISSTEQNVSPGGKITVKLNGQDLEEVYAYEAVITFQPDILGLSSYTSSLSGGMPACVEKTGRSITAIQRSVIHRG